jgi:glutamate formiminotransferase
VPNASEGRRPEALDRLAAAASRAPLLDLDADPDHNRAVLTLAGFARSLEDAILNLAAEAAGSIDLRLHTGVHPRVGALDVVPVVPLERASLADAAALARRIGERIWRELRLPVYFYGAVLGGPSLAEIRAGRAAPALGAGAPAPAAGAVCVGARPPLVAYNVLFPRAELRAVAELARGLRASSPEGGGMPGVQALAFQLPDGRVQLSMNLVDLTVAPPAAVRDEVRRRAAGLGIESGPDELVGLCPAAVAPPAAAGKLLEARAAAAAARAGAARARRRAEGGEELLRLGARLEEEAAALAAAGVDDLLAVAERTAALPRVLHAGGILEPEPGALLAWAARSLRAALPAGMAAQYPDRIRLLDRWLHE